jgi:hypothetical protein
MPKSGQAAIEELLVVGGREGFAAAWLRKGLDWVGHAHPQRGGFVMIAPRPRTLLFSGPAGLSIAGATAHARSLSRAVVTH